MVVDGSFVCGECGNTVSVTRNGVLICGECNTEYRVWLDTISKTQYYRLHTTSRVLVEEPRKNSVTRRIVISKNDTPTIQTPVCNFCHLPVYEITKVQGEIHWLRDEDTNEIVYKGVDADDNPRPVPVQWRKINRETGEFIIVPGNAVWVEGTKEILIPEVIKHVTSCPSCISRLDKLYPADRNRFTESYSKGSGNRRRTYFHSVTDEFGNTDRDVRSQKSTYHDKDGNLIRVVVLKRTAYFERFNVKLPKEEPKP